MKGHKKEIAGDEFFVFEEKGIFIGIISLITDVSNVAQIRDLVVKQDYRKMGYGKKILENLIKISRERKIRKIFALTFPEHEKMFFSLGFEKEGFLKSHFEKGEDLSIMSLLL